MKSTLHKNNHLFHSTASKPFFGKDEKTVFFSTSPKAAKPFFTTAPSIQAKLAIGQPGDRFEQEADQMADFVVNNKELNASTGTFSLTSNQLHTSHIQRLPTEISPSLEQVTYVEEEQGTAVQPLRRVPSPKAPLIAQKQLENSRSGMPLLPDTRGFMESKFGADFSSVRIHDNETAARFSESIQARAFTYGKDIYFNKGEYQPHSKEGNRVLAHELTHVVQQGGAGKSKLSDDLHTFGITGERIQRIGRLGRSIRSGVTPWGPPDPVGTNYEVQTDAGTTVTAWVAYSPYTNALRYWCHGHSLGTYDYSPFGFSVYSGVDMRQVITDEWTNIPADQTRAGDIAVWTSRYDHSAKFTNPVIQNGSLEPATSMLSTKNGQAPLANMSLAQIMGIYGGAGIAVFRHR